jgi:hypothetical protein
MPRKKLTSWRRQYVSNEGDEEHIDDLLTILSKPLSRYILSVLAGADPGVFTEIYDENDTEERILDS